MKIVPHFNSLLYQIAYDVENHKRKLVVCVISFVAGIVIGCVIYGSVLGSWWCDNRYGYVISIVENGGFFSLFFRFLLNAILLSALTFALSFNGVLNLFKYVLVFFCGLYLGIYIRLAIVLFALRGIFYIIFLFLCEQSINSFAIFLSTCTDCCKPSAYDVICGNKFVFVLLSSGIIVKTVIVFVFLRLLTALI